MKSKQQRNVTSFRNIDFKERLSKILRFLFMNIYLLITLFPIYFALISSVKSSREIFLSPFKLPTQVFFDNYTRALQVGNIANSFINSIILTSGTIIMVIIFGSLAAFILARFKFKIKSAVLVFFIAGMTIPIQSVIIPLSYMFGRIGMNNNYLVLMLLFTAFNLPVTIFIIYGFLLNIPTEIEEAAVIDGSNAINVFYRIIFPIAVPAISTTAIFVFLNVWNNLLFPLIFITRRDMQVIAVAMLSFFAERTSDYGGVMAAIMISILPPMIAYFLFQEKVESGLMTGAVKG